MNIKSKYLLYIYSATLFVSAALLFWVQPMYGKMILPYFGSSPNVWNTCMVFYQAALLLGYVYAHVSIEKFGVRKQAILHLVIILLPLCFLPIGIPEDWSPPGDKNPIPYLLGIMAITTGIPFFVLSATAPMLQKWFSKTSHESSSDPYFLYVASNLGSMIILISYPFLIEPNFSLVTQSKYWQYTYFALLALLALCAYFLLTSKESQTFKSNPEVTTQSTELISNLTAKQRLRWIILSFVPSSLMLGVTTFFSTDISPVPLMWIAPLVIYLLTFIIVFSKDPILLHEDMVTIMPYVVLGSLVFIIARGSPIWFVFLLHLIVFFVCTMVCHGELARSRPHVKYLTEFYLWISVGGCLGGIFNAIVAPIIFNQVIEYPLVIVLACLLKPIILEKKQKKSDLLDDLLMALVPVLVIVLLKYWIGDVNVKNPKFLGNPYWLKNALIYGIPAYLCIRLGTTRTRFSVGVAAIILVYAYYMHIGENILYRGRNFFGIHKVATDACRKDISLYHNTTLHGSQKGEERNKCEPTTYYSRGGPIGQVFSEFEKDESKKKIAALGIGTGSIACYGKPYQDWFFYEIDPDVVKLNEKEKFFTYFKNSQAMIHIIYGDGRLKMKEAHNHSYDFIILDAFSSDAIPVHLCTREALNLYLKKLKRDGIIAFHISNKFLNLSPVFGNLAKDANLVSLVQHDHGDSCGGRMASEWLFLARKKEDFRNLITSSRWKAPEVNPKIKIWTDDYSNILSIFEWGRF